MAPKEPTRQQLSSRLTYQSKTPAFLLKLQRQVAGRGAEDDEYEPQYVDDADEGELDEFGRERRRPPITETPKDDPHRSDEEEGEEGDEKPVIVVVKEGKHLSEREVENEKRKAKGLAPLGHEDEDEDKDKETSKLAASQQSDTQTKSDGGGGLSFSSNRNKASGSKRKVLSEEIDKSSKKKVKKSQKGSLSFDQNDIG